MESPRDVIANAFSSKRYQLRWRKADDILNALEAEGYAIVTQPEPQEPTAEQSAAFDAAFERALGKSLLTVAILIGSGALAAWFAFG